MIERGDTVTDIGAKLHTHHSQFHENVPNNTVHFTDTSNTEISCLNAIKFFKYTLRNRHKNPTSTHNLQEFENSLPCFF